jgi:hypothetical protein
MNTNLNLTQDSLALFLAYAADAGNWGGNPLVGGNVILNSETADRGNLTQLKKAGLLTTWRDEGCTWINFTKEGKALAAEHGMDLNRF